MSSYTTDDKYVMCARLFATIVADSEVFPCMFLIKQLNAPMHACGIIVVYEVLFISQAQSIKPH